MTQFEEQWQRRFERYATRHRAEHLVSGWSPVGLRQRVLAFERLLDEGLFAPDARVLEVGCGAGTYVRLLGKRGHEVVGLDYSLPTLGRAVEADPSRRGRYVAGEAYRLPFEPATFEAVMCIGVFQSLGEPGQALAEMARVLRPGGVLLVETLNPWNPLALARRVVARVRRRPALLLYSAPRVIERLMNANGVRPWRRMSVVLPPRSLPRLEAVLVHPWVESPLRRIPGLRGLAAQAFWLAGVRG
jgi:SAM-dependent methyltransferase